MENDEVKPAKTQDQPKAEKEATPLGNMLVGALAGVGLTALATLLYWEMTQWVPSEDTITSSTYFRNGFLGIVAIFGIAVAIWRSKQTDRQIKQSKKQFLLAQKQFTELQKDNQTRREQETFQEACRMLADSNKTVCYAGWVLLERLENIAELSKDVNDVLDAAARSKCVIHQYNPYEMKIINRQLMNVTNFHIMDMYFFGDTFQCIGSLPTNKELEIHNCIFFDCSFNSKVFNTKNIKKIIFVNCIFYSRFEIENSNIEFKRCIIGDDEFIKNCNIKASDCVIYYVNYSNQDGPSFFANLSNTVETTKCSQGKLYKGRPSGRAVVRTLGMELHPDYVASPETDPEAVLERHGHEIGVRQSSINRLPERDRLMLNLPQSI